jgi:hypothetical protein
MQANGFMCAAEGEDQLQHPRGVSRRNAYEDTSASVFATAGWLYDCCRPTISELLSIAINRNSTHVSTIANAGQLQPGDDAAGYKGLWFYSTEFRSEE